MRAKGTLLKPTVVFILVDSLIWLLFGLILVLNLHPSFIDDPMIRLVSAGLSWAAAVSLIGLLYLTCRFAGIWYYFLLLSLVLISFLTLTDEFGWPDLIILILHLLPMAFLIIGKRGYPIARISD